MAKAEATMLGGPVIPVLGYTSHMTRDQTHIDRLIVGMGDLTLDGRPFPWATVGDWTVTFRDDGLATLTVAIAVSIPKDPAAPEPVIEEPAIEEEPTHPPRRPTILSVDGIEVRGA